jgi:hypothetical protein
LTERNSNDGHGLCGTERNAAGFPLTVVLVAMSPGEPLPILGLSPVSRRHSAKVRALLEYLEAEFSVDPFVSGYGTQ